MIAAAGPADLSEGRALAARDLKVGSKSFALAGKLLPQGVREDAATCYAFCRFVDDAVDEVPHEQAAAAVQRLRLLLDELYAHTPQQDPRLSAFAELVQRTKLPREYPLALIDGMAMDAQGTEYQTLDELRLYCHRVAGVVGLMMCHVLGVRSESALPKAAHLGIAMQLTNICRDVAEDWTRGRLYLPFAMVGQAGPAAPGQTLPPAMGATFADAVQSLLAEAEIYYRSGQRGLRFLSWRAALAIRVAAWVYRDIGRGVARRGYDVTAGRVVISLPRKLWLAGGALLLSLAELPSRVFDLTRPVSLPTKVARYPDDIVCVD
ncbi:MAG: phytoene/squalene synthase family protein [Deltaproteobacteria bacterium]|nr:phytoene/squalene synthase family protein [Deltaproteobacteria bacterium]